MSAAATAEHRPVVRRRRFAHDDLVAVDLFSGFGGLTRGIELAGFTTIMAANHNRYKVEVHEANHPHAEHWIANLVDRDSSDYHSARDLPASDLLVAGVSCFAAGSLVLTRRGLVPIETVCVGDEVWTHRARWRPVTRTSAVERPTITVNATTAITCTRDHPFWAASAEREYQPRRKYQPLDGACCLECGGTATRFRSTRKARLYCSTACRRAADQRRALPLLGERREVRADSLNGVFVGSPILDSAGAELPVIDGIGPITHDIACMLGRWVGDGWVSRRPERNGAWSRVTICASHAEADELGKELSRLSLPWNRTRQRTTDTFHVNRLGLATFIVDNFGHGAGGKRVPTWMLFAPRTIRQAFVDGYMSADGYACRDGLRVQAVTVSKELAVAMRLMLTSLDYYATVTFAPKAPAAVIEGRVVRQRPQWVVTAHRCRDRRPKHRDADGYRWGKASGTVTPGDAVTVYNMTVDEDHTYVVDGVVVHNCTNHSQANTKKAYAQSLSLFDMEDPDFEASVTRSERDRATANCVLAYAAQHHPRLILVECTTELTSWGPAVPGRRKVGDGSTYRWWLGEFGKLGYRYRVMYLNSMFFGVPQSRDRLYIAFWDRRIPTPDLEHRPPSWCGSCGRVVEAVWTWRTGVPPTGSVRYGKQYEYRCPSCRHAVRPPVTPSLAALDLSNLGTRIGDRKKPLAAATMARAERCRQRFAEFPAVLMPAKAARGSERHPWQPMATQTSQQETAILSTGAAIAAAANTCERPGSTWRGRDLSEPLWAHTTTSTGPLTPAAALTGQVTAAHRHNGDGKHLTQPMDTVTSTHEKAVLFAVNNFQGAPRAADEPLPTQGGSETLSLLSTGVVPYRKHTTPTTHAEAMPTVTSEQIPALITAAGRVQCNGSIDEAKYRAYPLDKPLGTVVGSAITQGVLFAGWYKQNGSHGMETASHPVADPLGTLTPRDTTALLSAEWRASLADLPLADCYFRMMAAHEIGRGCGFDVTFGDYPGTFLVWGSARDQTDGFGNAVSPQVGEWIGRRLRAALHQAAAA
ncbi:DNA cytosine methyltransferase [Mycobacterium paragordonae]|uniref:DNA cytosine methyltransferase n=1 Tax=Mycobacterium paragordonae TaxID=1389713 RepID=A0AAJ1W8X4_9MYCO|nr:DNA cytosine methyltransferase [Mycobacterium paragordonae]MDP7739294.1 DNA cytosine methyltransferase [Mycobacterium paragordonae]TDK94642.1 hypothetical protein EI067_18525 [Mycobacterium paragordonae]